MFKAVILAIAESLIIHAGKTIVQKVSLQIKKSKIQKELKDKLESEILACHSDGLYYNALDSFLYDEKFAEKNSATLFQFK